MFYTKSSMYCGSKIDLIVNFYIVKILLEAENLIIIGLFVPREKDVSFGIQVTDYIIYIIKIFPLSDFSNKLFPYYEIGFSIYLL